MEMLLPLVLTLIGDFDISIEAVFTPMRKNDDEEKLWGTYIDEWVEYDGLPLHILGHVYIAVDTTGSKSIARINTTRLNCLLNLKPDQGSEETIIAATENHILEKDISHEIREQQKERLRAEYEDLVAQDDLVRAFDKD